MKLQHRSRTLRATIIVSLILVANHAGEADIDCNQPQLVCDSISASKNKCGFAEFGTPSSPPKRYLTQSNYLENVGCPGPPCFGVLRCHGTTIWTYDPLTCALTNDGGVIITDNTICGVCGAAVGVPDSVWSVARDHVTSTTTASFNGSVVCPGPSTYNSFNDSLSNEYTTDQLKTNTEDELPDYSGFDGPHSELGQGTDCSAYRDLSADETSYNIQKFNYKFTFPAATQSFSLSWVERFTPAGGGQPIDTPQYKRVMVGETSTDEYPVDVPPSNGTITIEEIVFNVQSIDPNNVTVEKVAPGPSHYLECEQHGAIWTESVDIGVSACFDGTYWRAFMTSLKGNYSVLAQLETCPSPQREVTGTGSGGNTTQENYCEQVRALNGLYAFTPGGWYMLDADYARQYAHAEHLRPILQSVAPEIGDDIQKITVSAQSEQEAIDLIKDTGAFANAKARALTCWDNMFLPLKPSDDVFGGAGDIKEHKVVDTMINSICAYANAIGWNNTNEPCEVCGPPSAAPPSAPTAAAATSVTRSGFTANWSSVGDATAYLLDVSTSSSFASYVSGYQNLDVGNTTSRDVTGLAANTIYYYRIRAYNSAGTSGNSNVITTPATIQVTVQTTRDGLGFSVDGTNYSAAQIFSWTTGSSHTIATTTPQSGDPGVRYYFSYWRNDNNGHGDTTNPLVVAPTTNTTYTGHFGTQYFLTISAGTGGHVSPGSSWRSSGTTFSISATPSTNYSFSNWTGSGAGSYSGTDNPRSITMLAPITETATFTHN